ncbi:type II secretion system protein GspL [Lacimicrobium alkaliphilum]|uniref:Type II secretion system protein L n=1 Tax=Lacimicrobium alkaliphilum TaxID=1526571 RepID=A0A0U2ZP47_9ALTE|nr:type II secretion system protein GspL [Lacimicrobium alkaliphilum]ALT00061.1 type II secretion system protein GspL [Lacimicrobium alkaliphilum]
MSEQLIIRLGSTPLDPIQWLVYSTSEEEIIASGELADASHLHSLKERAADRPVTALAPTSDILLQWVTLPARAGRKVVAAIPFMLEDELSTDIDSQLFAIGPRQANQQAVAVVAKEKVRSWLTNLEQAGLRCHKLIPDILALPEPEDEWPLLQIGEHLLLRQDKWKGIQGESEWLLSAVSHYARQQPETITIANYSDLELPSLPNISISSQQLEMPMKVLASGALACSFNLLQGEFKPRKQASGSWQKWRLAAVLAGIALTTSLIDKGIQAQQLASEREHLEQQIRAEFKRAMPEITRTANVKSRMEQKLQELQQGGSGASMLAMLAQLAQAFEQTQLKPQTLRFDSSRAELRMQAEAKSFEALEQFRRLAESQGFSVQQGAINNTDNQVISSLSIRS